MMRYWGYGPYNGGFGFAGIFMIVWWLLVAWLIVAALRFLFGHGRHHHWDEAEKSDTALDILRERYAKGEISKKEFDAIKKDIS